MFGNISEEQKKKAIEIYFEEYTENAKRDVADPDRLEKLLRDLEVKLAGIPALGGTLSVVLTLISLVKNYIRKEYTDIPVGSLIAIVGALGYFLAPLDLIPDAIPLIGYADDAAVMAACLNMVKVDLDQYRQWRDNRYIEQ